jgi:hypothetical protein
VGHGLVHPVNGQRVLDQVVGADGEEVHVLGQQIGDGHRRGHLDHDTHLHLGVERVPSGAQLLFDLLQHLLGLQQLAHPGDEGEHHPHLTVGRGPQDGPQLGLEQPALPEAVANGPKPQGRVDLRGQLQGAGELVPADVQGADANRPPLHALGHGPEVGQQLLLRGQGLLAHVEELSAVQADALGAVGEHAAHLLGQLDVGAHVQAAAVNGLGAQVGLGQYLLGVELVGLLLVPVLVQGLFLGVYHQHPAGAVHDDEVAAGHLLADPLQTHHRRYGLGLGHDGRMAGGPAHVGDEAHDPVQVHQGGIGRAKVVGHHHHLLANLGKLVVVLAGEVAQQQLGDVGHVRETGADVLVLHVLEHLLGLVLGQAQGPLGVDLLRFDQVQGTLADHAVLQDGQVGLDDVGVVGQGAAHLVPGRGEFLLGGGQGGLKALGLLFGLADVGQGAVGHLHRVARHHQGPPDGDARADPHAAHDFFAGSAHAPSPKSPPNNCSSASRTGPAWGPWAWARMVLP